MRSIDPSEEEIETYSNIDHDRARRCGFPEVVYAESKEPAQVAGIVSRLLDDGDVVLATRVAAARAEAVQSIVPDAVWAPRSRILFVDRREAAGDALAIPSSAMTPVVSDIAPLLVGGEGLVDVCCAGTSDIPVAEEAALTCRIMGSHVEMINDVGVAGVHRTLEREEDLRAANAIVVVAGMEGALPSLIAGLVSVPVFAVPTSVGYGANL
jgi:NCAIR mutase (PurE)-related protein